MGMNFKVGLFEEPMLFWAVLAVIVLIAPVTIASPSCGAGSEGRRPKATFRLAGSAGNTSVFEDGVNAGNRELDGGRSGALLFRLSDERAEQRRVKGGTRAALSPFQPSRAPICWEAKSDDVSRSDPTRQAVRSGRRRVTMRAGLEGQAFTSVSFTLDSAS